MAVKVKDSHGAKKICTRSAIRNHLAVDVVDLKLCIALSIVALLSPFHSFRMVVSGLIHDKEGRITRI